MRRQVNRRELGALGLFLAMGLAGCTENKPTNATPPPTNTNTNTTGTPAPTGKPLKAALVLDTGGVDDKSFNAAAWIGLQRTTKELGLSASDIKYVESKDAADYKTNLTQFANGGYDVVFAVGYLMEDALKEVAPQFPKVKFAIVDGNAPEMPNVVALQFKEQEGCFLAGFLAASVSKTHKLGFVGGQEIPLIKRFEAGYRAGAMTANPKTQVLTAYTGDWNDVTKGKNQAMQILGSGADIVFHAAGKAGLGVIQAASEKGKGFYAIGVDRDQDDEAKGRILTSMVKRVDTAVFDTVKRVKEGTFQSGKMVYDLKQNGIGLSEMRFTKQDVPAEVLSRLETLTQKIASGEVVPPSTLEELKAFQPPKL